jgi:hypothetical protein
VAWEQREDLQHRQKTNRLEFDNKKGARQMKNADLQKALDTMKWLASEEMDKDMSGEMVYCPYCPMCDDDGNCGQTQEQRVENNYCAKAYNKMKKKGESFDEVDKIVEALVNANKCK